MFEPEVELNKLIEAVKRKQPLSIWKNSELSGVLHVVTDITKIPKTRIPNFNFNRVRNQVLGRIKAQKTIQEKTFMGRILSLAPYFRLGLGITATFLIVVSLTLGTAVAALDSVPGSAIYPLKKVVENIQLKLTPNDQKANLQLKFATNRINELEEVLEKNQEGKLSDQETSDIVATTVKDLQKNTTAASSSKNKTKSTAVANKLADISNKLRAATVVSDGQIKIELQKALEATKISEEEAISNLEKAGLKVENSPIEINDSIKASGKLTTVTADSVSIGTAKFLLTSNTKYTNLTAKDIKAGLIVDIIGEIKDNKSYAIEIILTSETKTEAQTIDTTDDQPTE